MTPSPADHAQLEAMMIEEIERRVGDLRKELREELDALRDRTVGNRATLVVFSGDLDRVTAALVIATGAASMGMEVSMFFTFWGLSVLKKERRLAGKNVLEKAFSVMTPAGTRGLGVSKMNFAGAGTLMFRKMMKDKDVASVEELFALARVAAGEGVELRRVVHPLADGTELGLPGSRGGAAVGIRVLATPGHTPGSTCYLVAGRWLLSGDTIFANGIGRPDLGGRVEAWGRALFRTLHRGPLSTLPDDVVVLPAHFASPEELDRDGVVQRRLGDIRAASPELRLSTEAAFVEAMRRAVKPPPDAYRKIIAANLSPAGVPDEQASEWELGKNQCAASLPAGTRG
jgi:peroxiredoxin family protein